MGISSKPTIWQVLIQKLGREPTNEECRIEIHRILAEAAEESAELKRRGTARRVTKPMTAADRQAKRREQFRRMREALEKIAQARTVKEAREIARAALETE